MKSVPTTAAFNEAIGVRTGGPWGLLWPTDKVLLPSFSYFFRSIDSGCSGINASTIAAAQKETQLE